MYEKWERQIHRHVLRVKKRVRQSELVCVFGVSDYSQHIIKELQAQGIRADYVIDNDERKDHMFCMGVQVIRFSGLCQIRRGNFENTACFICSSFWREMKRQCMQNGFRRKNLYVIQAGKIYERTFAYRAVWAWKGKGVYQGIRAKYGTESRILLCPYTGTGDIYLIGSFLQQYIAANRITSCVLVVVSRACKKVADLFRIPFIEVLPHTDVCSQLIAYYMLEPDECDIQVLNDSWGEIYTNPAQWIRGYKGYNFTEMFRQYVFRLPEHSMPVPPDLGDCGEQVNELFKKYDLETGRTVILSPYAVTLADMPGVFWEELVKALRRMGFTLCTNSCGEKEPAVRGTKPVFFPLNIAPRVVEKAGYFIGIRSGFCDVISSAQAKKIILYDRNNWFFNCSAYEYFSLNKMGLCEDAVELEFDQDHLSEISSQIIDSFKGEKSDDSQQ